MTNWVRRAVDAGAGGRDFFEEGRLRNEVAGS